MLWLHETHRVRGAHEEEFEAAFREGWMPTLAKDDDARLLYFMHLAHGSGRAYVVTTITAVRDGAAWERVWRVGSRPATCASGPATSTSCATA